MNIIQLVKKNPYNFGKNEKISTIKVLNYANDKYRNTALPVLTDEEYDTLYDILKERDPK